MNWKIEKLKQGETFVTREKGNSMVPLIYSIDRTGLPRKHGKIVSPVILYIAK
jgi:hypothetical protein